MRLAAAEKIGPTGPGTRASPPDSLLEKAVVVGAGSMGSGIAAHLANAGVKVLLLDIVPEGAVDRDGLAKSGIARQLKAGGFMHPEAAGLVEAGNVEDDLWRTADADWIVEAVFEDIAVKQALYSRLEAVRRDGSIVSSNTSTIPLGQLIAGLGERFADDFVITHFFNPPRHMQLLEIVGGRARPEVRRRIEAIGDITLGKSIVSCRDTPGFIANRIGNYWMSVAVLEALRQGLTVEDADAVMSTPFGIPRTGIFGLFDFVGINLVPLVWGSFMRALPAHDAHRAHDITADPFIADMLARGLIGRAGPGGFYRRRNAAGERVDEVIDFETGTYRARQVPALTGKGEAAELGRLCESPDKAGRYAWTVLSHLVAYAAEVAPEIAEDIESIDRSMRLGYNWKDGPFELADRVGVPWLVARLEREGRTVPLLLREAAERGRFYTQDGSVPAGGDFAPPENACGEIFRLADINRGRIRVDGNASASLWDMGDGVAALEIHTRLNACDTAVVELIERAPSRIAGGFQALVIGSDDLRAFSAGANLDSFIASIKARDWNALSDFIGRGQSAWLALKYAPFPVVAAANGLALGGGCELMMHADAIVAHAELYAGLPELKVGIIPGWGGVTQQLLRWTAAGNEPNGAAIKAFDVIAKGEISGSALLARDTGFLRPTDEIVMNRDRLLALARMRAEALASGYAAPARSRLLVSGQAGLAELRDRIDAARAAGVFTETDAVIALELASVVTGGGAPAGASLTEEQMMHLELAAILELAKRPTALARLEHMRATNKPLRN